MSHKIMKFKINKKNKSNIFLKGKKIYFKPFEEEDISETYKRDLNDISNLGINIIFPKNKVELSFDLVLPMSLNLDYLCRI